ncbi:MAG TPA: hypothetical protein VGQ49_04300 [Bryobacteraceae bacterium]|jgi:tetratricopeptide (TPR) repeat protein|nr:hypothetical protein [Bryobacteraceae bacterium]
MGTVPALTLVSLLSLAGAGCASKKIVVKPFGPQPIAPKAWKSVEEAQLAETARQTREPAAATLTALDNWEAAFPKSDFADVRLEQRISAYQRLQKWQEAFDSSRKLLEIDPFRLRALLGIVTNIHALAPPTERDLVFAAEVCRRIIDVPDVVFNHVDRAGQIARPPVTDAALLTLGWIDMQRHDYASAVPDFYVLLARDPTQVSASYQLGIALLNLREPSYNRAAFYHITRAAVYEGPNALPPEQRKKVLDYVVGAYKQFFGSSEGFDRLAALAKASAFPSGDFK